MDCSLSRADVFFTSYCTQLFLRSFAPPPPTHPYTPSPFVFLMSFIVAIIDRVFTM